MTELRPDQAPLFGAAFTLEVDGAGFDADAVVVFDGVPLTTRIGSNTTLEADVPAEVLVDAGIRGVVVLHTGADGGVSSERGFAVVDGIAAPFIDALVPDRAVVGAPAFVVTVRGWNFYPTSVVHWAGAPRATTYVNASELQIAIDPADLAVAGDVAVTVVTEPVTPSSNLTFVVELAPVASTLRLSVTPSGGESVGQSADPSISSDGRYAAFASSGDDLVAGDGGRRDIFWCDTCRGASGCTPTTVRVSERLGGGDANGDAQDPMISANGRFVAFSSNADDLVVGGELRMEVYVHDTCLGASGCTPSTIRVSELPGGFTYSFAIFPSISSDGRFVAFTADTTSVWLRDTCIGASGCTPTTTRIDAADDGTPGDRAAESPAISANGRYVAFKSNSTNLDGGPVTGFRSHAYVVDTCFGATACTRSISRLDVATDAGEANDIVPNGSLSLSADGRFASFSSIATNLVAAPTASRFQVYIRDTCAGATACTPSTTLGSSTSADEGADDNSMSSCLSSSGRFLVFQSAASDLAAGDTNGRRDVFVRDTCFGASGCTPVTRRISIGHDGQPGDNHSPLVQEYSPRISTDGVVTVWTSRATNIVADDTNNQIDAFVAIGAP